MNSFTSLVVNKVTWVFIKESEDLRYRQIYFCTIISCCSMVLLVQNF